MSSCGNPSTDQDGLMPRRLRFNKGKICIKCKVNQGRVVIRHAVYCKECFAPLVTMKFRRSLEPYINANAGTLKRPELKAAGSLVLGFSGGLGSSILLDMVYKTYFAHESPANVEHRGGINHPRNGNVWASCAICYVEVCSAFPEVRDRTNEIINAVVSYSNFEFLPLRLEYAFDDEWWRATAGTDQDRSRLAIELGKDGLCTEALRRAPPRDISPVAALRTYLESLPTQTAVSNAIRVLVRVLLLYTAQSRRASHLLLGTSLTTLSISLISCISQGGGHSILQEFQEDWHDGILTTAEGTDAVRVVRPLRDVTMKECSIFAWWNSIHVVGRDEQTRAVAGIHRLTKDFIVGLEKDYPSTVSAIARTCAKVEPKSASLGPCVLCQRPIQEGLDAWKSRIAIRSYFDIRLNSDLAFLPTPTVSTSTNDSTVSDQYLSISAHLCYSCRTTLTSRCSRASKPISSKVTHSSRSHSSTQLPVWASASRVQLREQEGLVRVSEDGELWVQNPQDEAVQRNKIGDFLLDLAPDAAAAVV